MKKTIIVFLALVMCCSFCLTSCQKPPEPLRSYESTVLYRAEGYQSPFTYFIETHDVEGWGPEMFGMNIFVQRTNRHVLLDPNGEANDYLADYYKTKDAKQEFTSAEPLTVREIKDLVRELGDILGISHVVLSDCVDGTYVFAIMGYRSTLDLKYASKLDETEYPKYRSFLMLGEAKSKEELSLFCLLPVYTIDNIHIGFAEGKKFYCQNGEFRKYGEVANHGTQ